MGALKVPPAMVMVLAKTCIYLYLYCFFADIIRNSSRLWLNFMFWFSDENKFKLG